MQEGVRDKGVEEAWKVVAWMIWIPLVIVPFWRMYDRAGVNKWWLLAIIFPALGYFVVFLVLAVSRWPNSPEEVGDGSV